MLRWAGSSKLITLFVSLRCTHKSGRPAERPLWNHQDLQCAARGQCQQTSSLCENNKPFLSQAHALLTEHVTILSHGLCQVLMEMLLKEMCPELSAAVDNVWTQLGSPLYSWPIRICQLRAAQDRTDKHDDSVPTELWRLKESDCCWAARVTFVPDVPNSDKNNFYFWHDVTLQLCSYFSSTETRCENHNNVDITRPVVWSVSAWRQPVCIYPQTSEHSSHLCSVILVKAYHCAISCHVKVIVMIYLWLLIDFIFNKNCLESICMSNKLQKQSELLKWSD